MSIQDWTRPSGWEDYPESEEQVWEINQLKDLSSFLIKSLNYKFVISLDDETCIHVLLMKEAKNKAQLYVNRGKQQEAYFSIYAGENDNEYHGSDKEKILELIATSTGYIK